MDSSNMASYMHNRRTDRKNKLKKLLGSKCIVCGNSKNLQFDHIHREEKSFTIVNALDGKWERLLGEIKKCQLLCKECHKKKTSIDVMAKHGTDARYSHRKYPCRCDLCKLTHATWKKTWRTKRHQLGLIVW